MPQRPQAKFRLLIAFFVIASCDVSVFAQTIDFEQAVAPILVSHCLECHQGAEPEGGLDLRSLETVLKGGDSGEAVLRGDAMSSLLWQRVQSDEMPPKHPLKETEKAVLKQWLNEGASWGKTSLDLFSATTKSRAGRDWWSLQPVRPVVPPRMESNWVRNEVDSFILKRLQDSGLNPSREAPPRELIRRLFFNLIGLPPTPEQVAAFVADPSEESYRRLVDELLNSSHYGERWGRHWLDVVRFGESNGFERNFQRENAWPYRDWVIRALNNDLPYDQFVRMQLVGDQLVGGIEGAAATGFWVAGVHNTTVGGSKRMKQLARQDEIEDVLATVGQTFVGLTFNCARCHDHKFDPITQTEYYQLASAISGLGFGERQITVPEEQQRLDQIDSRLKMLQTQLSEIDDAAREQVLADRSNDETAVAKPPMALSRWEFDLDLHDSNGHLDGTAQGNARVEDGALFLDGNSYVETSPITQHIAEKTLAAWVQLDSLDQRGGAAITIAGLGNGVFDAIVFGEREPRRWMAGSNSFLRSDSFGGPLESDAVRQPVHVAMVYESDGTIIAYRNGVPYGQPIRKSGLQKFEAHQTQVLFGLRHKPVGGNRFLTGRIHSAALYDRALSADEVAVVAQSSKGYVSEEQLVAVLKDPERKSRQLLKNKIGDLKKDRSEQTEKAKQTIYTLTAGAAQKVNVLLRGDPDNVGDVVSPAATAAIKGMPSDFGLPPDAPEMDRRRKLAAWVTNRNNPLFARVITNRIWHYHFGTGIVETPNDFGFNGGRPSHPELLEYLSSQLQANGYRLKWLHRQIVMSSTYRQASHGQADRRWQNAIQKDAANRLLWRGPRRRLEAESLRDAMLTVSGQLNKQAGGPSFKDVSVTLNSGTTYYEPLDVDGPEFFRRTVYRFNPRGGRSALLDTFDCPDPSSTAPRRSVTTTPLQSLSLMNNSLVLTLSNDFAKRVRRDVGDDVWQQVSRAWQLAIARRPDESERQLSTQLVSDHGLEALCRGLFNLNEFVVIE